MKNQKVYDTMEEKVFELENLNREEEEKNQETLKKYPKYLPIGSVVTLKEGKKKLFIAGFAYRPELKKVLVYDYIGYLYPDGISTNEQLFYFNHSDIEKIHFLGYRDLEEQNYKKDLVKFLKENGKEIIED